MSVELIKYAFISGEISPTLFGRTDLTKYDFGVALGRNWFVDYRGGLSTRAGTEFIDYIKADNKPVKMFEFQFSPDLSNTYTILFGDHYIRFLQDGAYVLTSSGPITHVTYDEYGVIITSIGHGYSNGDWVKFSGITGVPDLNGFSFVVSDATSDDFRIRDPRTGNYIVRTGEAFSGTVYKVYEISSPYAAEDLDTLNSTQIRDILRLTSADFPIYNLTRIDHDNWTLQEATFGGRSFTWSLAANGSDTGDMSIVYAVSAVMSDGDESSPSIPVRVENAKSFATGGTVSLTWAPIPGAVEYIVYKGPIAIGSVKAPAGSQLGFAGRTKSTVFIDANIIPDYTKGPYENYDPFAPGKIENVIVATAGTGYSFVAPVTATDTTGTDFSGYALIDDAGHVVSVVIINAGRNYTPDVVITIGGSGSGATAFAELGPTTGIYPSISATFQRRQVYAASHEKPLTIWGSKIDYYWNFDSSTYIIDSDSYEFDIDSAQIAPLLHIFSLRGGLVMLSQTGIWLLTGGGGGNAVTPTNVLADPQSFNGVSKVRPLQIGSDLLYIEGKGFAVRLLSYNDFSKVYSGEDKSILSNHLFNKDKELTGWAFAENPYKLVYGVRSDGALTLFTTVKEQDVYAWTWGTTRGKFKSVISIPENRVDTIYVVTERIIEGVTHQYLERFKSRQYNLIEEAYCVDCGLQIIPDLMYDAVLNISTEFIENDLSYVTLTSSVSKFTGKENWVVRAAGGKFVIKEVTSGTTAKARVVFSATDLIAEDPLNRVFPQESWSLAQPQTEFSGLFHLEGEEVSILGDGNVFPRQTVVNGKITLPDAVSMISVGMGFDCIMRTLPPTVTDTPIEAKRKRVVGVAVRLNESRGIEMGHDLNNLYPLRERTNEAYGTPIIPLNGYRYQILPTEWDEDAQTYFVQSDPLPANILALVPDLDIGDDTN